MIAKRVIFTGHVQNVGFRYTVKDLARAFDVRGWVKNLPDGTVELQVTGEPGEVNAFIKEIAGESNVAHHIKSFMAETIPLLDDATGFRIVG
ncbi:MAG: acylphosphatase [Verrucomicrobia bacterium]|nr:MAG: acylphosphatase [Verrucomicrobiota bacterium]